MITIKYKDNIKDYDFGADVIEIVKATTKAIANDITANLVNSRAVTDDIEGDYTAPKPLTRNYLNWKKRHCSTTAIYHGLELALIKSIKSKITGKTGKVFIGGTRKKGDMQKVAEYVNDKRKFFAISKKVIQEITEKFKSKKIA